MTGPLPRTSEQFGVFRRLIDVFALANWRFARHASEMIGDFVFHDADEPRAFRTASLKIFVSLDSDEKCFLNDVFGGSLIAQSEDGVLEQVVAMLIEPRCTVGRFIGRSIFQSVKFYKTLRMMVQNDCLS